MRIKLMAQLLISFLMIGFVSCSNKPINKPINKPNIVFIFTDDQTYTSIQALGNEEINTSNMDKLVEDGTSFIQAFNMGAWNGAVCVASRAMIISGRSVWRANEFRQGWLAGDSLALEQSWGRMMEKAGYDTYMTGKWHVDAPADLIFNEARHVRPGMPNDTWNHAEMERKFNEEADGLTVKHADLMPLGYNRPKNERDNSWSPTDPDFGGYWEGGTHWSEVVKDDAVSFIRKAKNRENPFFMYLAFNAPHDPRQSPQEFLDQYPLENISLPESWLAEYPYQNDIGNGPTLRDEALAPFPRTPYATKKHLQEYYAIITHLDQQIGEIIGELEATGQLENTYLFFTSDHGLAMGRHGLLGKQSLFDHSIRVPLIAVGPDILKGKKINAEVYLQDVMATSLEVAGIERPDFLEFHSFLGLAKGTETKSSYPSIYGAYMDFQRMIRKGGFKLIVYPKIEKVLLFDLNSDPEEIHNLADHSDQHEKLMSLFQELMILQQSMGDKLNLNSIYDQWENKLY